MSVIDPIEGGCVLCAVWCKARLDRKDKTNDKWVSSHVLWSGKYKCLLVLVCLCDAKLPVFVYCMY
jgi:hypothetical protein